MFFSKKLHLRLGESVLAAQRAIVQTLEVLTGHEIVLCDLEMVLDKITVSEGIKYRNIGAKGCAYQIDPNDALSPPFKFEFAEIPFIWMGNWQIQGSKRVGLVVDELVGQSDDVKHYTVHWTYADKKPLQNNLLQVHIAQEIPKPEAPAMWIVGRNYADRHKESVFSPD